MERRARELGLRAAAQRGGGQLGRDDSVVGERPPADGLSSVATSATGKRLRSKPGSASARAVSAPQAWASSGTPVSPMSIARSAGGSSGNAR